MYHVYAINHLETAEFSETFIDKRYAWDVFIDICSAVDCKRALINDAFTGEIFIEWEDDCMTIYDKDGNWEDFLFE